MRTDENSKQRVYLEIQLSRSGNVIADKVRSALSGEITDTFLNCEVPVSIARYRRRVAYEPAFIFAARFSALLALFAKPAPA